MTIAPGTRLGPYEIVSRIGAGGMGEVFKAHDTRLDRSVAIKVLPSEFAANSDRKLRFEREAKAISQLNHPNICTLYDVGTHEGVEFLVMELIDGESLAERLTRGALPLTDVLSCGAQIAEALDRAHRAGIVHRDLKPANVMITRAGAKLLDFGLAKASQPVLSTSESEITAHRDEKSLTEKGTILGTFQYMAPEQLEGEDADARTDIFALGVLLYEMTTGRRAFEGKTRTSLIAAIVSAEPPRVSDLQPLAPALLEHVIRKCIAKDREQRWQSAHDIAEELRWISEAGSQSGIVGPLIKERKRAWRSWLSYAAIALLAAALTWIAVQRRHPIPRVVESSILSPEGLRFAFHRGNMTLSPDGKQLAFLAGDGKRDPSLFVRRLDGSSAREISGTQGSIYPFWSADSTEIGFFADGKLKSVDSSSGTVRIICDAPAGRGGSWSGDGAIVFTPNLTDGIYTVAAGGGTAQAVTRLGNGDISHAFPSFLPDGKHFLFLQTAADPTSSGISIGSLDGSPTRRLAASTTPGVYAAPDFVLYWRAGLLVGQRIDLRRLSFDGPVVAVADKVTTSGRRAVFSVSDAGDLAFSKGGGLSPTQLVWVDRQGKELGVLGPPGLWFSPSISHDGRRVAVDLSAVTTGFGDIWIYDLTRNLSSRLTYDPANESGPVWTIDDRRVIFFSDRAGRTNLYSISSGGAGNEEALLESEMTKRPMDVSPDGRWLLFSTDSAKKAEDIWLYSLTEKKSTPWLTTQFSEGAAQFSPDGKWIAYQSNESGRQEIYVRSFPDSEEKWQVSNNGGRMPTWRKDGHELYYISLEHKMMAVPVARSTTFSSGAPASMFEAHVRDHSSIKQYAVSADGSRFLLNRMSGEGAVDAITLVQNWKSRLKVR